MKVPESAVAHKFLFDVGSGVASQFLGIINTCVILTALGDRIKDRLGFSSMGGLVAVVFVAYIAGTWLLGLVLDRLGYLSLMQTQHNLRNAAMRKILEQKS